MPPVYNAALQTEYSVGHRNMQDLLLEGDGSYDIDTLNPSLTDLQLQGNTLDFQLHLMSANFILHESSIHNEFLLSQPVKCHG